MIKILGELEENVCGYLGENLDEGLELVLEVQSEEEAEYYLADWVDKNGVPLNFLFNWMLGHYKRVFIEG